MWSVVVSWFAGVAGVEPEVLGEMWQAKMRMKLAGKGDESHKGGVCEGVGEPGGGCPSAGCWGV